ncbi:PAS domain-containing protein [Rhizobium sp. NTR19]|uniref:histidine kinase n=1 Tax=Neorhizobium turbinariae TaxID=2937795 RepID=A0ABT0IWK7_9HYPH|nr:PAS domain-containing protein [Neorhizobium turbinariae]MCK8782244.1 PAS domain-containing protein [Neorhizobium turbinariae]
MELELVRVLDALPGLVLSARPDGSIDFVNTRLARIIGQPDTWPDPYQLAAADVVRNSGEVRAKWKTLILEGEPFEIDVPCRHRSGDVSTLKIRCSPMQDGGKVVRWYALAEEDHSTTKFRAHQVQADFQRIVDSIPVPVAVTTPSGDVEALNDSALAYFGMSLEELKNWKATEVVHPDDLQSTIDDQLAAHVNETFYNVESRHLRSDGVYRWHNVLGLPLKDTDGRILRWFHLLVDIDDRKRAEIELAAREREARLIVESIPAGIAVLSPTGEVEAVNGHLMRYYGRTLDDLGRWEETDVVHPEDMPRMVGALSLAIDSGNSFDQEVRLLGADGVYRWFQVTGHPLKSEDGTIIRWYSMHVNVDDRRRAEEALKDSEFELRKIINALPLTVWTSRPDGYWDFVNDRWLEYAGLKPEEAEGRGWESALHPDDADDLVASWKACLRSGTPADFEARVRRFDGEYRWFLLRATPYRDADGSIIKWYGTNIDIEDRKLAERALSERERESRFIVDGIAGMIAIFSPDAQLIGGNQQILDYFQLPLEALNNWATNGITHPDDLQLCIDSFMGSIATGEPYDYETRFLRHDGVWRWFQLRGLPLRDADGRIVRWYGLLTDIDDRKRAEERLRRSEAFLVDAQRLSKTGSFWFKLNGDEITWSDETYRIFGVDPSTHVTLDTVLSRLDPDSMSIVLEVIDRARHRSEDFDYEITLVMPDQSTKNVRVLAHSGKNKDGDPELIGAVQDITESRKAEEALNEARSDLAYVTRVTSLGVLTASIAHEVNQPLAGIVTNASTCVRALNVEPPKLELAAETARRMIRDANRAADVIVRLRALFSRKPPVTEAIDINEIATEVIALALSDLQRNRVSIVTDLGAGLPRIAGARIQLQQVVMNLLRNSIEAMAHISDRQKRVIIKTVATDGGAVELSVSDVGIGFRTHEESKIFDAFYTTKQEGMGIGLSVSRSIVESHNGRLWARANADHGVTVAFSIPQLGKGGIQSNIPSS